jgi:hypothetical protein
VNVVTAIEMRIQTRSGPMKDALAKALAPSEQTSVDRIMAASFFRARPMQAGTAAEVVRLDERRVLACDLRGGF